MEARTKGYILGVIAVGALFVFLRPPSDVDLDAACQPKTAINKLRATVLGSTYWRRQLDLLDTAVERIERFPKLREQINQAARQSSLETQRFLDSIYAANPALGSRRQRSAAAELRELADRVEREEMQRTIDSLLFMRAVALLECRDRVQQRADR